MADILDFTKPYVLRNEEEYNCAVAEIDTLLDTDPQPRSEAYERLEFLSVLVQAYEDTHCLAYEQSTPQEVVDFMLEQKENFVGKIWQSGWAVVARQQNFLKELARSLFDKLAHCERIWVFQRIC